MKSFIQICGLSLILTFGLTLSNPAIGSYYFYESQFGVEDSDIHQVRLKRDAPETENTTEGTATTTTTTTTSTTSSSKNSKIPDPESPVSDVSSQKDNSKSRGWISPEQNHTMLLKEMPEANLLELPEVDLSDENIEKTLNPHLQQSGLNISSNQSTTDNTDHHKYYNSTFTSFNGSWIDLEEWNKTIHPGIVFEHPMLSKSYRRAATIPLKFDFPFYGHDVRNITIATGGFLYTGDYVHSWLAATQYIAPLMANFDTSQKTTATVKYADNGTALVVEWGNVYLQGREGAKMEGPFTFQAILHKNGDIVFAYKSIPVKIKTITDDEHPVKVGLSDAYIIERTIFFVRRKTIYEYHRVDMKTKKDIGNETAIYLKALPRCNMMGTCEECLRLTVPRDDIGLESDMPAVYNCKWCPSAKLCSDGFDRSKQKWLKSNCDKTNQHYEGTPETCSNMNVHNTIHEQDYNPTYNHEDGDDHTHNHIEDYDNNEKEHFTDSKSNVHHAGVATITIVILLILTICGWFLYAYFFPHSCSGQFLIKHRPSRWHWRRGEARYTAASIHM